MPNNKIKGRKEATILREVSLILEKEIKNDILKYVSIAEVRLSNDSEVAKLFWSFLPVKNVTKEILEEELSENLKIIRMKLSKKLETRTVPNLIFVYDTSLDNASKIEAILKEINNKK